MKKKLQKESEPFLWLQNKNPATINMQRASCGQCGARFDKFGRDAV